ncbi:hypothetical protein M0802_005147 [Mischocyttarus mexicanus]|nr:hypothetical protein M0802_005147 [Mischocyttarus mexicanus]
MDTEICGVGIGLVIVVVVLERIWESKNRSKDLGTALNVLSIVSKYLPFDLAKRLYGLGYGGGGGGGSDVDRLEKR